MPTAPVQPTFDWSQVNFGGQATNPYNRPVQQAQTVATAPAGTNLGGGTTYTTQPVSPTSGNSPGGSGSTGTNWWDNWNPGPSAPSATTGQQTAYQIAGSQATGGGTQGFTWEVPQWMRGLTSEQWASPTIQQAVANYMAGSLPFSQLQQNSYQYTNDFNEAQRRWDQQFAWTQQGDQFNQNLSNQQQQMAQWVAQQQQNNWQQQFGLDSQVARDTLYNNARTAEWNYNLGVGGLEVDRARNVIDQAYKQGLITNEQYANESQRLYQTGQLANQRADLASQDWYNRAQIALGGRAEDRQLGVANRQLALADLTQAQLEAYRRAQLAQEGALAREGYQNQQAIARMNAFGRTQAPRARWVRSW